MFCSKLRERREWAAVLTSLTTSQRPKWDERNLITHDICIPMTRTASDQHFFRFLLLSPSNLLAHAAGMGRIERLYHLDGGERVGIVFLLHEPDSNADGVISYMELQARLLSASIEMPILPLHSVRSLQATLLAYQQQLLPARASSMKLNPATDVLPYCSSKPPLPEHTVNVVSEVCRSFRDLAMAATTRDGQLVIREWVHDQVKAEEIIEFWLKEYLID